MKYIVRLNLKVGSKLYPLEGYFSENSRPIVGELFPIDFGETDTVLLTELMVKKVSHEMVNPKLSVPEKTGDSCEDDKIYSQLKVKINLRILMVYLEDYAFRHPENQGVVKRCFERLKQQGFEVL